MSLRNLFMVHDIDGSGFPVALQDKVMLFPSVSLAFDGYSVISG